MLPRLLSGWEFIPCVLSSKPSLFGRRLQSSGLAGDVSGDTEQALLLPCALGENVVPGIPDGKRKGRAVPHARSHPGRMRKGRNLHLCRKRSPMRAPICALNLIYSGKTPTGFSEEFFARVNTADLGLCPVLFHRGRIDCSKGKPTLEPHIPPCTFPNAQAQTPDLLWAWEAPRDPLFPPCHPMGAAQEAAGVCGCAAVSGEFTDAAPGSTWGAPVGALSWEMLPNPLFPAACFCPGWEHRKPSWVKDDLQQEQSPRSWVRVCSVLPGIWGVNWNDLGMLTAPALHP